MFVSGLTGWSWLWDNFFYVGAAHITARAIYVYWPRKGSDGQNPN